MEQENFEQFKPLIVNEAKTGRPFSSKPFESAWEMELFFTYQRKFSRLAHYKLAFDCWTEFAQGRYPNKRTIMEFAECMRTKKGNTPDVIKQKLTCMKVYFNWRVDTGRSETNPIYFPRMPRVIKKVMPPMTEMEYERLRCLKYPINYMSIMGWETGLRLVDVTLLKWSDIDQGNRIINVTPLKTSKSSGVRLAIPYGDDVAEALADSRRRFTQGEYVSPWLVNLYKRKNVATAVGDLFHFRAKQVGVLKRYNAFRHAFISRLLNKGVTPAVIGSITGQSVATVLSYAMISQESKRKAMFGK